MAPIPVASGPWIPAHGYPLISPLIMDTPNYGPIPWIPLINPLIMTPPNYGHNHANHGN
jgi:hypothetical protein